MASSRQHHALQQSSSNSNSNASSIQQTHIRRQLFSSNLSRRTNPTYHSSHSSASGSGSTMTHPSHQTSSSKSILPDDILDRDEHGAPKYSFVPLAPLPRDELKEEIECENRVIEAWKQRYSAQKEAAKRNRGIDLGSTWRPTTSHQMWLAGADPTISEQEMKAALQAYLNRRVASLDEDAWMFDGDDGTTM